MRAESARAAEQPDHGPERVEHEDGDGGEHDGARGRAADALRAAGGPHPGGAADQRDREAEDGVLELRNGRERDPLVGVVALAGDEREAHTGGQPNKTEVVMLDAKLLGIEELPDVYMASVEFSGMIREDMSAGPSPFREVWNMTKPVNGSSGWLVAGVQALQ